ncbi:MAG: RNA polymerase sigma factor [Actinomycetota bacterium]|nr:RNA polymerase sigma factor [Actinomycetota bacterium]
MAARSEELVKCPTACVGGEVDIDGDRRLVIAHQRGDRNAFDVLYRRYNDRLVQYCWRRVGDRHVAEELAQETFLRALQALPRFAGDRRFYPWLTVIAGRLCIDHHRRDGRVVPAPDLDTGSVEPAHDAVYAAVDRTHLRQAVTQLAPRHREVLALREERGWSYQRIADHLEVSTSTVEALLHRARRALRRQFLAVGGGRLGALPAISGLVVGIGRLRNRLPGAPAGHLGPWAASAAAGIAAVSLAVTAVEGGAPGGESPALSAPSVPSAVVDADPFRAPVAGPVAAPVDVALPLPAAAPSPGPPATESILVGPPPTTAPARPGVDLEVVAGLPVPADLLDIDQRIADVPARIDLDPVADLGLDPTDVVTPLDVPDVTVVPAPLDVPVVADVPVVTDVPGVPVVGP